jgi:hypothetical protein
VVYKVFVHIVAVSTVSQKTTANVAFYSEYSYHVVICRLRASEEICQITNMFILIAKLFIQVFNLDFGMFIYLFIYEACMSCIMRNFIICTLRRV